MDRVQAFPQRSSNGPLVLPKVVAASKSNRPPLSRPPPTSPVAPLSSVSPPKYIVKKDSPASGPNAQRQLAAAQRSDPKSPSRPTKTISSNPFDVPEILASDDMQELAHLYDTSHRSRKPLERPPKLASHTNGKYNAPSTISMDVDATEVEDDESSILDNLQRPSISAKPPPIEFISSSSILPPNGRKNMFSKSKVPEQSILQSSSLSPTATPRHGLAPASSSLTSTPTSSGVSAKPRPRQTVEEIASRKLASSKPSSSPSATSKIDAALEKLGEPIQETPKRLTRAAKKKEVVLIELSDGEDEEPKSAKPVPKRRLLDDILDEDEPFEDNSDKKVETTISELPDKADPESPIAFHLPYYQDDIGTGHVAADEPTNPSQKRNIPQGILFDSSLVWTISMQGISVWQVLPSRKSKSPSNKSKSSKTPSKSSSSQKKADEGESINVDVMDVDDAPDSKFETKKEQSLASTIPGSSKTHLLLSHISPTRIISVDVFAQPGLFFVYTNSGSAMTLKRKKSDTNSGLVTSQGGEDPKSAIITNDKKRSRKEHEKGHDEHSLDKFAPNSKKSPIDIDGSEADAHATRSQPDQEGNDKVKATMDIDGENGNGVLEREPSKNSLDLSYEVGEEDISTTIPPNSSTNGGSVFEEQDTTRLFIFSCDRQALNPITSYLMQLSKSKPVTTSTGDEASSKREKTVETGSGSHWFEVYGRASDLAEIPADLANAWWKPEVVAEADKKVLKSPTRLKPPTPSTSQSSIGSGSVQMPKVLSKNRLLAKEKGEEATYLRNKELQLSTKYCAPHPIGDLDQTIVAIANSFETLRAEIFGKRWPFEMVYPCLRGLVAYSIINAPPLYISTDPTLFHVSTLKTPLRSALRSRKNEKTIPRVTSFSDSDTPVITFPKSNADNTKDEDMADQEDEEGGKSTTKTNLDSVIIRQGDVDRLQPGVFLNDVLVNFYLMYIEHELMAKEDRKRVKIFSSYFFTLLYEHGYARVQKWLSQLNIFDYDYIIIPINLHLHWKVAILCHPSNAPETYTVRNRKAKSKENANTETGEAANAEENEKAKSVHSTPTKANGKASKVTKSDSNGESNDMGSKGETPTKRHSNAEDPNQSCILILDSLGSSRDAKIAASIRQLLSEEAKKKGREVVDFDSSNLTTYHPSVPQQPNYTDCGLFLLHYVEKFCLDLPSDVSKTAISSLMGPDWFPASEVSGKRKAIANRIDSLLNDGYGVKE